MKALRIMLLWLVAITLSVGSIASEVVIVSPDSRSPVFGEVEVSVAILGDQAVDHVEISIDGGATGILWERPYRLSVDVGEENRDHEFTVRVVYSDGSQEIARVVTPARA